MKSPVCSHIIWQYGRCVPGTTKCRVACCCSGAAHLCSGTTSLLSLSFSVSMRPGPHAALHEESRGVQNNRVHDASDGSKPTLSTGSQETPSQSAHSAAWAQNKHNHELKPPTMQSFRVDASLKGLPRHAHMHVYSSLLVKDRGQRYGCITHARGGRPGLPAPHHPPRRGRATAEPAARGARAPAAGGTRPSRLWAAALRLPALVRPTAPQSPLAQTPRLRPTRLMPPSWRCQFS
jgi:hypothetical protein